MIYAEEASRDPVPMPMPEADLPREGPEAVRHIVAAGGLCRTVARAAPAAPD